MEIIRIKIKYRVVMLLIGLAFLLNGFWGLLKINDFVFALFDVSLVFLGFGMLISGVSNVSIENGLLKSRYYVFKQMIKITSIQRIEIKNPFLVNIWYINKYNKVKKYSIGYPKNFNEFTKILKKYWIEK